MAKRTHGMSRHPLYQVWNQMRQRCLKPDHPMYRWYGGRGITVCERWTDDFLAFLADMAPRPDGFTLERIDNDKGYSPENCRWATRSEQAKNRAPLGTYLTPTEHSRWKRDLTARLTEMASRPKPRLRNPPKVCQHCGAEYSRQGHTKHPPKFCSPACYHDAKRAETDKLRTKQCAFCGMQFRAARRLRTARYCTVKCAAKDRVAKRGI